MPDRTEPPWKAKSVLKTSTHEGAICVRVIIDPKGGTVVETYQHDDNAKPLPDWLSNAVADAVSMAVSAYAAGLRGEK